MLYVLVITAIFCICGTSLATVFSNSLKTCQLLCSERNLAFPLARGEFTWKQDDLVKCDFNCRVNSCHHGCRDLDEPLSKCETRCTEEGITFDSCAQGCYAVEQAFLVQVQELLYQVSVTIDALDENLRLRWQFPDAVLAQMQEIAAADVGWFAQSRPTSGKTGWRWTALPNTAFRNSSLSTEVHIPLEPTTQLQVRLALSYRNRVGVSRAVTYQMPLRVVPSKLEITSQLQLAADKVAICWKAEASMTQFKIALATLDGNSLFTDNTDKRCYLLESLPKENCCRATVTDVTVEEPRQSASVKLDVIQPPPPPVEEASPQSIRLVFSTGTRLLQMRNADDYIVSEEPLTIPFEIPDGETITSLEGISSSSLVVGSSRGSVWFLSLEYNDTLISTTPTVIRQSEEEEHPATQIEYDSMQNAVYVVLHDKGIARCTLEDPSCFLLPNSDSLNPIRAVAVDSINGFLYFLGADHQVYRSELLPFEKVENYQLSTIVPFSDIPSASAIEVDREKFQLLAALKNGTILAKNLISGKVTSKRSGEFHAVKRLLIEKDRLFWWREKCGDTPLDEMCFYSEDNQKDAGDAHFSRYLYSGKIVDFAVLREMALPPTLTPPEKIGLIMSDTKAKVSWIPPVNLPFQVFGNSWRNISYEVRLVSPDTPDLPVAFKMSNETCVTLTITPGAEYTASVRVCWHNVCSPFVNVINTAFVTLKYPPIAFLKRSNEATTAFDLLGDEMQWDAITSVFQPCCDGIMSFDNTTKTLYSLDSNEGNVIYRRPGEPMEANPFTSFLSVKFLTVLASRASLVLASSYQIISYRLTGTLEHMIYTCSSPYDDCAEVIGLSSDDVSGEIHFLAQFPNGSTVLYELNQDHRTPRPLATSNDLPQIRQLLVTNEKVIFVTQRGRVGQCDKKLGSLNVNYALVDVNTVVPVNPTDVSNYLELPAETVVMGDSKKDELSWAVEPRQEPGTVLYKVSLYKEKLFAGDAHILATTSSKYNLPSDLLQSWSSAQRFDANIVGITAWMSVNASRTGLQAPLKPPAVPTNVRLYATQQKTVDGARAIISLFWSPPVEWNAAPFQYIINCTKDDGTTQGGPVGSTVTHISFEVKSGKVECSVAAANEPNNVGEFSPKISIDSSELKPLVRLFAIDSTNALIAITNVTQDEPSKREKRQISHVNRVMEYQAIAFIGNDLFAIRKEHDSLQPVLVQIDTNDIDTIVHKVSIGGDVSRVDTMTSDWVGHRLLLVSGQALYQLSLDAFLTTSLLTPRKLIELTTGATDAKQLTYDPFKNTAYLLTRNGSLFSMNLARSHEKNLALVVPCLASQTVTWMMTEFAWNRASSPKVYALTWNGLVVIDVEENNKCNEVRIDWNKFGEKGLKAMSAFAIADKLFVFVTSSEMLIYGRETVCPFPIAYPPLRQILAVSQSSQPYPDRSCFALPSSAGIQFTVVNEGKTGAFLEVSKPPPPNICHGVSLPQTHYEVYFNRKNSDKVKHIRSYTEKIHVENGILDKETDYDVTVAWLNRYSDASGISDAKPFRTGFGYPSAPRSLQAVAVTPDTIYLYWNLPDTLNAPIAEIKYKISQQAPGLVVPTSIAVQEYAEGVFSPTTTDSASCLVSPCRAKIANLRPATEYKFWATSIHKSHLNSQFLEDSEAISQEASARTKDIPGTLRPDNVTGSSLLLRWNSLQAEQPPSLISVQYKESGSAGGWKSPSNASFDPSVSTILVLINGLLSATSYDYRFVASYTGTISVENRAVAFKEFYYQGVHQAKTKAGVPTAPLQVEARMDEEGWIVSWKEPSSDGGSPITSYAVEMRHNRSTEWEIAERGLDGWKLWWRPARSDRQTWEFRVRATNAEGFGAYGYSSETVVPPPAQDGSQSWLYVVLSVSLVAILILLTLIFLMIRARARATRLKKERNQDKNCITLEKIAGLEHAPCQPMPPEMLNEIKNLPHVKSDDIRLEKKLGTGSFGEVWEGVATRLPMRDRETKVAVKTLRQGYEEAEKIKFMKEAILMNNFDHPNIVKLLGVCLEGPKQYLILELMEGGDLLNFLRASSPTDSYPSQLSLRDVLSMLIDIGRGGAYLESNRHVHRDLAARNCLISSRNPHPHRVTKIGALRFPPDPNETDPSNSADFGLSRGVCDSEYYRVRGEDFLPLRWLAPECIMEGMFSSKSDVWAFGILMYEIVGLGQKPYFHMDNTQVLAHVKNGGTPSKPVYCPDPLFKIMQLCWAYDKDERPTFVEILSMFEKLRDKIEFQDDKPYPPYGGHYNGAFDLSQDSTSSEKMEADRGMYNQGFCDLDRFSEQNRFDKLGSSNASIPKQSLPLSMRSMRKESKTKPLPLLGGSNGNRADSSISNDTFTTSCDYNSSYQLPSFASSSRTPFLLPSNLSSYESPKKKTSLALDNEQAEEMPHSRSWAGPSRNRNRLIQPSSSAYSFASRPGPSDPSSSQGYPRKSRTPAATPSSSYDSKRRSRVSQV